MGSIGIDMVVCGLGRVGSVGGGASSTLPGLLGGLLNGELSAWIPPRLGSFAGLGSAGGGAMYEFRDRIRGFSARLTGGGTDFGGGGSLSRFSSADLLGGGGEGGCEAASLGDLLGSSIGVWGLLGILNGRGDGDGVEGVARTESGFRNAG